MSQGTAAWTGAGQALSRRELFALPTRRTRPETPAPSGVEEAGHWIHVHRPAMACRVEVTLPGEDAHHVEAAREALDEVDRLEAVLTVFSETSEVAELNRTAASRAVAVGPEVLGLLQWCEDLPAATEGAF